MPSSSNLPRIPIRYLPYRLSKRDTKKQLHMLAKSKNLYKRGQYYTRKRLPTFKSRESKHVQRAKQMYGVDSLVPSEELSKKTGCSISALQKIVNKGEGAYFSSGSRPNQTAQSWGIARLASSITAGKSAAVDFRILEKGCDHRKTAYRLATQSRKKYRYGHSTAKHRTKIVL